MWVNAFVVAFIVAVLIIGVWQLSENRKLSAESEELDKRIDALKRQIGEFERAYGSGQRTLPPTQTGETGNTEDRNL